MLFDEVGRGKIDEESLRGKTESKVFLVCVWFSLSGLAILVLRTSHEYKRPVMEVFFKPGRREGTESGALGALQESAYVCVFISFSTRVREWVTSSR